MVRPLTARRPDLFQRPQSPKPEAVSLDSVTVLIGIEVVAMLERVIF